MFGGVGIQSWAYLTHSLVNDARFLEGQRERVLVASQGLDVEASALSALSRAGALPYKGEGKKSGRQTPLHRICESCLGQLGAGMAILESSAQFPADLAM